MGVQRLTAFQRVVDPLVEMRTVWFIGDASAGFANAQFAAAYLETFWTTYLASWLTDRWVLYQWTTQDMGTPAQPVIPFSPVNVTVGLSAGDFGGLQVAALLTLRSFTARPNLGRKYFGGLVDNAIDGGLLDPALVTDLLSFGEAIVDYNAAQPPSNHFVIARVDEGTGVVTLANEITAYRATNVPATQRRRRPGVGI